MRCIQKHKNNSSKSMLYRVVFGMKFVQYVTAFLFLFFVLHPTAPAFASEDIVQEDEQIVEEVSSSNELDGSEGSNLPSDVVKTEELDTQVLEIDTNEFQTEEISEEAQEVQNNIVSPEGMIDQDDASDVIETNIENEVLLDKIQEEHNEVEIAENNSDNSISYDGGSLDNNIYKNQEENETKVTELEVSEHEVVTQTDLETLSQLLASSTGQTNDQQIEESDLSNSTTTPSVQTEVDSDNENNSSEDESTVYESDTSNQSDSEGGSLVTDTIEDETNEGEIQQYATDISSTSSSTLKLPNEIPLVPDVNYIYDNGSAYQFLDTECVSVGDGSFYCSEKEGAPEYIQDGVFSAPDSDGDMEIFVTINGETTQITNNLIDDASPYYDGLSDTIVWHSMVNDRFQIAQYSVTDGEVNYLTNTSYNNMEPVAYSNVVLWQAWVNNNWEIMFFDGEDTIQLTDNQMHDITPQMRDGYIMWQTQFAEGWKIALYDMKTQKVEYIADGNGSEVANPRFVLVYDSTDKIGDVQTLGYDFGSGSSFVLGSLPAELPEEIPEPDQTGETRALIQAKPSTREGEVDEVVPTASPTGTSTPPTSSTSTLHLIEEADLIIDAYASSSTQFNESDSQVVPLESDTTSSDTASTTSSDVSHIQDIVIPPLSASTTEEVG